MLTRVLWLALPRVALIYLVPFLLAIFSVKLELAAGWSHWLISLIGPEGWANDHLKYPLMGGMGADAWWEKSLAVLMATALMLMVAYFLYSVYKNLIWDRSDRREADDELWRPASKCAKN